uniref:Uncharacterized protein n=1 Tax=Panagrolaimus superbus TaxID=310955 RepID=A0A914YMC3_9BILA
MPPSVTRTLPHTDQPLVLGLEVLTTDAEVAVGVGHHRVGAGVGVLGALDVGFLAQLAAVAADGDHEVLVRGVGHAAFHVHALAAGRVLVTGAGHHRDGVVEVVAQVAEAMQAPVGRVAVLQAVGQGVLDIAHAVELLDVRDPRHVGGTDAQVEGRVEAALHVGLLDEQFGVADGRAVLEVGGQVGRPDVVELVVDGQVEALDVQTGAAGGGVLAVAGLVDVGQVEEHATADLVVIDQLGQLVDAGLGLLCTFPGLRLAPANRSATAGPGPAAQRSVPEAVQLCLGYARVGGGCEGVGGNQTEACNDRGGEQMGTHFGFLQRVGMAWAERHAGRPVKRFANVPLKP